MPASNSEVFTRPLRKCQISWGGPVGHAVRASPKLGLYQGFIEQHLVPVRHAQRALRRSVMKYIPLVAACALLVGCGKTEVNVPGVNVKVGPGGVQVTAPGVDVNAGGGGASVKAPGVDVKTGPGGAKVDVEKKK